MTSYYKLHYKNNVFYAQVDDDESDGTITLRVGGSKIFCVTVHIFTKEKYAYLQDLFHDALCTLEGALEKSIGTIHLVEAAVAFCKMKYPYITHIELTDQSIIRCNERGKVLPLPEVYMLLYGYTWYENKFNAHVHGLDSRMTKKLTKLRNLLASKPHMSFNKLWSSYLSLNFSKDSKDHIAEKYSFANTWHDFFKSIRENNCVYWFDWVRNLFLELSKGLSLTGLSWSFDIPLHAKLIIEETSKIKPVVATQTRRLRLFGGYSRKCHKVAIR